MTVRRAIAGALLGLALATPGMAQGLPPPSFLPPAAGAPAPGTPGAAPLFVVPRLSQPQPLPPTPLVRSEDPEIRRGVTVANRPRPEYDPAGVRFGPVTLRPLLRLDTIYDDNILASGTRRERDWIFGTTAALEAQTTWRVHEIRLSGQIDDRRYLDFDTEDTTAWRLNALGRYDLTRFQSVEIRASAARYFVARDDAEDFGSVKPIAVDERVAQVGYSVRENRAALRLQGYVQQARFQDTEIVDDVTRAIRPFDQSFRNRDIYLGSAVGTYEFAPLRNAVLLARVNRRNYVDEAANAGQANGPLARSSTGYDVLGGVEFDYDGIFGVRLLVGWLQQFYEDDRLPNASAPTFEAALLWNPTTLTSVRFTADRQVTESIRTNSSSILRTNLAATIDHELLRNVLLQGGLGYRIEDYRGISRVDRLLVGTLGASWLINRTLRLNGTYTRQEGDKSAGSADYDRNIFLLRLSAAL
jgi:hypothetical protein